MVVIDKRTCTRCKETKPNDSFYKEPRSEVKLQQPCKECKSALKIQRTVKRKIECIEALGGVCVDCGTTQQLEFDHVDPSQKLHNITNILFSSILEEELRKCVLRCKLCHRKKSAKEKTGVKVQNRKPRSFKLHDHGTMNKYAQGCRCDDCRLANHFYVKYKTVRKLSSLSYQDKNFLHAWRLFLSVPEDQRTSPRKRPLVPSRKKRVVGDAEQ